MNISNNKVPSMKNIYESTYWNNVKQDEQNRSNELYKKAENPYKTGVVSKNATSDTFKRQFYSEINEKEDLIGSKLVEIAKLPPPETLDQLVNAPI